MFFCFSSLFLVPIIRLYWNQTTNSSSDWSGTAADIAQRQLAAFVEEPGVHEIARWYEGVESSRHVVTDVRAQQAYVAQYVAERQATYGAELARRQKEEWKSRSRAQWVRLEREGVTAEKQGQGSEEGKARRERVAAAAD
jgi:hypothetical protein